MSKVVIYGIGRFGKKCIDFCISAGVTCLELVDSDSNSWGGSYQGMTICNPDDILWSQYDLVVITIVSEQYREEVMNQLLTIYKVPKEKIKLWGEILISGMKEFYNLGNMKFENTVSSEIIAVGKEMSSKLDVASLNDLEKFFFLEDHKPIAKWMHYFEAYDRFFSKYRGKDVTILEIGVFKGGSLQMWKNYFKTSTNRVQVYGIDIDPYCKMFEEDNIKIFIGSQEDREFLQEVKKEIGKIDILIDDGGHTMNQQIVTFEELFDCVADDGIYLCEDLHTSYWSSYGGGYRGETFVEYSKNLIDYLHAQYSQTDELVKNVYSDTIKFITYCDSMIFIEKKPKTATSVSVYI